MAATSKDDDYDREGHRCRRCIFWLRGNFYDSFGSIGNGHHHLFCFFFKKRASELSTRHLAGSKLECVELCNFYFCCALIFCQPMKKFEFFGVSRATRQRHSKTSSTGDENDTNFVSGTQKMFLILVRNILCPQQMFPSLRNIRYITSNNVSATMCPRSPVPLLSARCRNRKNKVVSERASSPTLFHRLFWSFR